MPPKRFKLEIVTPFRVVFSGEVNALVAPGIEGYFGVLPGHTPFLTALRVGEIKVTINNTERYFATSGGFAEVLTDTVTVLAETAEAATEIDVKRAMEAKARAERRLQEKVGWDLDRARAALMRALNRLSVAQKA